MSTAAAPPNAVTIDKTDFEVIYSVDRYLKDGLTLKAWYEKAFASGQFA